MGWRTICPYNSWTKWCCRVCELAVWIEYDKKFMLVFLCSVCFSGLTLVLMSGWCCLRPTHEPAELMLMKTLALTHLINTTHRKESKSRWIFQCMNGQTMRIRSKNVETSCGVKTYWMTKNCNECKTRERIQRESVIVVVYVFLWMLF